MTIKIADLMSTNVVTVEPNKPVSHLKSIFSKNSFSTVPVVNSDGEPIGIVSATDLIEDISDTTPIKNIMTEPVYTIPQYNEPDMAARLMRNHKIHHIVVTHEQTIVGIISSFDLLKLVEGKRFIAKQSSKGQKAKGKRRQAEVGNPA